SSLSWDESVQYCASSSSLGSVGKTRVGGRRRKGRRGSGRDVVSEVIMAWTPLAWEYIGLAVAWRKTLVFCQGSTAHHPPGKYRAWHRPWEEGFWPGGRQGCDWGCMHVSRPKNSRRSRCSARLWWHTRRNAVGPLSSRL